MKTIILITILIIILCMLLSPKDETHDYNASFGDEGDWLSPFNHGFSIGGLALTKQVSTMNMGVFASTGAGKTSSITLPSIYSLARAKSSLIINDVSGKELFNHSSKFLAGKGYTVKYFNPNDPIYSETFNPLSFCKSVSDIKQLAQIIWLNTQGESKGDMFWQSSGTMLLALLMRIIVFHHPPELATFQNVLRLLEKFTTDSKAIDKIVVRCNDESLFESYKAVLAIPERTLQNILISSKVCLSLWEDENVCRTTSSSSIDFTCMRTEAIALFVCTPVSNVTYYRPITAMLFQTLFDFILSRIPENHERFIYAILEEFPTYIFPRMSTVAAQIRKMKGGLMCSMQSPSSLSIYGDDSKAILANMHTKVYLRGTETGVAKELSQRLGKFTFVDEGGVKRHRELLTVDEIHLNKKALVLLNGEAPLLCEPKPYFENFSQRRHFKNDPLELPLKEQTPLSLINFKA